MKRIFTFFAAVLFTTQIFAQDMIRDQHYSAGNYYQAITLKDYNNDGIVDVWSGNNTNNHIEIWIYSTANDTLVMVDSIYNGIPVTPYHIHDIDAADLDGDGDIDAVATFRSYGTYLCINEGSSNWTVTKLDDNYGWQCTISDLDNDGNDDILIATDGDYLRIYYGDGSGSFTRGAAPAKAGSEKSYAVNVIDINNDNYPDITGITTDYNSCYMRAYLNKLNEATPSWSSSIASNDDLHKPNEVKTSPFSAGDLNGDGYVDLVYFSQNNGNIVALMGGETDGNLTWQPDTLLKNFSSGFNVATLIDLDGDNDLDIIAGGGSMFKGVVILENDGSGNFTFDLENEDVNFGIGNFHDVKSGDIDGNGADDIICAQYDIDNNTDDGFHVFFFEGDSYRVYVNENATGNNDGTSWDDAYTDLQSALNDSEKGDTIWVSAGTYKPSVDINGDGNPSDNRAKTFYLPDSIPVFGGFNGTETAFEQRDPEANETVLSGDIGVLNDSADNCYNVVRGKDYSVLDGFTISDGNADGTTNAETDMGGGIFNKNVKFVKIANCILKNNSGKQGSGIANIYCTGPIYVDSCTFYNNIAGSGAGIGNWDSKVIVKFCLFVKNIADVNINSSNFGGGIYNWGSGSTAEILNCTFIQNAGNGSAIHNRAPATTCKNSIIWQNTSDDDIANTNGASCDVTYCDIDQAEYESGTGCFNSDPLFYKVSDVEYELQSNSPCINAGDPDPIYNDPDGSRNNMGANHDIYVTTAIENPDGMLSGFKVYPNPATDILKVHISKRDFNNVTYRMFDMNGKIFKEGKINSTETYVDMTSLPSSVYFIKIIENDKGIKTFKIIKK